MTLVVLAAAVGCLVAIPSAARHDRAQREAGK